MTSDAWQDIVYTAQPPINIENMHKAYNTLITASDNAKKYATSTDTLAHTSTVVGTNNYAHVQMYTQNSMECEHDNIRDVTV